MRTVEGLSADNGELEPGPGRFCRQFGFPVRLLHRRNDHADRGPARPRAGPGRRDNPRLDQFQHLPLHRLQPDPGSGARRRAAQTGDGLDDRIAAAQYRPAGPAHRRRREGFRPGGLHDRYRPSGHAACEGAAQPARPRPDPVHRRFGGTRHAGGPCRADPRRDCGDPDAGLRLFHQGPADRGHGQGALRGRYRRRRRRRGRGRGQPGARRDPGRVRAVARRHRYRTRLGPGCPGTVRGTAGRHRAEIRAGRLGRTATAPECLLPFLLRDRPGRRLRGLRPRLRRRVPLLAHAPLPFGALRLRRRLVARRPDRAVDELPEPVPGAQGDRPHLRPGREPDRRAGALYRRRLRQQERLQDRAGRARPVAPRRPAGALLPDTGGRLPHQHPARGDPQGEDRCDGGRHPGRAGKRDPARFRRLFRRQSAGRREGRLPHSRPLPLPAHQDRLLLRDDQYGAGRPVPRLRRHPDELGLRIPDRHDRAPARHRPLRDAPEESDRPGRALRARRERHGQRPARGPRPRGARTRLSGAAANCETTDRSSAVWV